MFSPGALSTIDLIWICVAVCWIAPGFIIKDPLDFTPSPYASLLAATRYSLSVVHLCLFHALSKEKRRSVHMPLELRRYIKEPQNSIY